MSLFEKLQKVSSEEDVKDIYIKALGLKEYQKNLIDIQTKEIWFEAKDNPRNSTYAMFTQLLHYVQQALNKGEYIPPFLAVVDTKKAAIMKSADVVPFLKKNPIRWGKRASAPTQEALDAISAHIGAYLVSFKIETQEEEFIKTFKDAIKKGDIIRIQITPDNLKQVFDKWVEMIGREIKGVTKEDYDVLFFADIMHDGTNATHDNLTAQLLHKGTAPVFLLGGKVYELSNKEGYRRFWSIYHKPPEKEHRNYLLERRDSLIPLDERVFRGAFYTPLNVVDKAYDKLAETLGKNWQKDYIVWDMCCGVGNLEVKHSNHRNVFMSTLAQADVDVMLATKTCVAATRFQYDYLNDDITDGGEIDYSLTNRIPQKLRDAIAAGKKILVLMNPPYAEAGNSVGNEGKTDVAKTRIGALMNNADYGYASRELFSQFIARIALEMPTATLAMFSTLKYVNAPNFEKFRESWNAKYLGGFVVHSKSFDGLNGDFPIGFLIWSTNQKSSKTEPIIEISTEVLDRFAQPIGEKRFYNVPSKQLLTNWIGRQKANETRVVPLINAVTPTTKTTAVRRTTWCNDAIGHMLSDSNDMQGANQTALFSSVHSIGHKGGFFVTVTNLLQAATIYSVRQLITHTWVNHNDQFLQPKEALSEEFKFDSLIWMLFHGKNLTASANGLEWNGERWNIVNHFIPFTEDEVGAHDRFESDFMVQYMKGKKFSKEAQAVLDAGRELWKAYFANTDVHSVREELKLNRPDVGWYQIRKALQKRNESGDFGPVSFAAFEAAYKALTEKLQPMVYELGFLKA